MSGIDWVVVGKSPTTVVLEDIQMDVAHQQIVIISADKASISKDLHRYVNQGLLFRVNPSPAQMGLLIPKPDPELERLRIQYMSLEEENRRLREENALLRSLSVPVPDPRLDRILGLLERGSLTPMPAPQGQGAPLPSTPGVVVDIETAPYIPGSLIPSAHLEGQIVVPEKTVEASGIGDAQNALRRLRSEKQ